MRFSPTAGLAILAMLTSVIFSCEKKEDIIDIKEPGSVSTIYQLPVVIHVIHTGEKIGSGYNLSEERILEQVQSLNDDFRRREGTLGYNNDALSADAEIEFKLAQKDPEGNPTNGINRVNGLEVEYEPEKDKWTFDYLPYYAYWDTNDYINIWVFPGEPNFSLGQSSLPRVDLPGLENHPTDGTHGIMIVTPHFGKSDVEGGANLGKSLTHEMGHFLGLEHLWGREEHIVCGEYDDYCDDTPPVTGRSKQCDNEMVACDGSTAMTNNYMDYTSDVCMNMFTRDQISRMRYVLENSEYRKSLLNSPAITRD